MKNISADINDRVMRKRCLESVVKTASQKRPETEADLAAGESTEELKINPEREDVNTGRQCSLLTPVVQDCCADSPLSR
ncbi:MAG: hypothetical protein KGN37_13540 [Burkholderiales bacterium]|nr:hypothetical protein [Burkholderiales bacterium]